MKNEMRKLLTVVPLLGVILCVASCREEPELGSNGSGTSGADASALMFNVGGNSIGTKAASGTKGAVRDMIPVGEDVNGEALYLEESVQSLDDLYFASSPDTKGIPVYTENFGEQYDSFGAVAKNFEDGKLFNNGSKTCVLDGSATAAPLHYKYSFSDGKWMKTYPSTLMFYMSAPVQPYDFATDKGGGVSGVSNLVYGISSDPNVDGGTISFSYTSPGTTPDKLEDVLFTAKKISRDDYVKETNNSVLFYHTLAGVKFKCGNTITDANGNLVKDGYINVTKIEVNNIRNSGTCVVTPVFDKDGFDVSANGSNPGYGKDSEDAASKTAKSRTVSDWKVSTTSTGSFALTLNPASNVQTATGANHFHDSFFGDDEDNNLGELNYMTDNTFKDTFFFVPQETPEGATIKITYNITVGGKTTEGQTKEIPFVGHKWYAGELYTYTITAKELGITIKDKVTNGTTKSDLKITNTRNTNEYIRVALVGNWFDNHEQKASGVVGGHVIVNHAWKADDVNNPLAFNTTDWFHADDGFWYYKYQLKGGATVSKPLFVSYTAPTAVKQGTTHLEMSIAVQAVDAGKIDQIPWPEAAKDVLTDKVDDGTTVK